MQRAEIVWHCSDPDTSENGLLEERADGWRISGAVVVADAEAPSHIDYSVTLDAGWRTQHATININAGSEKSFEVAVKQGRWEVNGVHDPALDGCIDIDLGFTPATNTLPIRRLALPPGERGATRAAWFVFPDATFRPAQQTYIHRSNGTWLYVSGTAEYELVVDQHGRVTRYGEDLWRAID